MDGGCQIGCQKDSDCDDHDLCTDDSCQNGVCRHVDNNNPCDDGLACTTGDHCQGGVCTGGGALDCDDHNPCTTDGCDNTSGCTHEDNHLACDDGNPCTGQDYCSNGACQGSAKNCDDAQACTDDSCDRSTGSCVHTANSHPCDDANPCTVNDACRDGSCQGTPKSCDDGNVCTDDFCNSSDGSCGHSNNVNPCDDGNACTVGDVCGHGVCTGTTPKNCDDGNACTVDSCNPASGCVNALLPDAKVVFDTGTYFQAPPPHPGVLNITNIISGDFNNDGIPDLATIEFQANSLGVWLGNGSGGTGDGTFAFQKYYPVDNRPQGIATGDFNADGILDLAVVSDLTLDIYLGQGISGHGNGTFYYAAGYPVHVGAGSLVAGDFNSDGILDLAVSVGAADLNAVGIIIGGGTQGQGNGTFGLARYYDTGNSPSGLLAGDFNADGILDIATTNSSSNTVSILLGNGTGGHGDGTFPNHADYPVGTGPHGIVSGDFNADGILDLAVVCEKAKQVVILLGNGSQHHGDGTFSRTFGFTVDQQRHSLAAGDFNHDGILDLAVPGFSGGINVYAGNGSQGHGDGTFGPGTLYQDPAGYNADIVATDFNGDGLLDIAVTSSRPYDDGITVFLARWDCP